MAAGRRGALSVALVELADAEPAGPGALGRRGQRRRQAVHVVAPVAVVAEQQLVLAYTERPKSAIRGSIGGGTFLRLVVSRELAAVSTSNRRFCLILQD